MIIARAAAIVMNTVRLNIFCPLSFFDLALRTQSHEFQQVAADEKPCFPFEALFEPVQFTVGEVLDSAAIAADQMMMVLARAVALEIAAAGGAYMNLTQQAVFLEQLKCTIYRHQPDAGIFLMQSFMDVSRPQMLATVAQHGNNGLPLGRKFESPLPELRRNILPDHFLSLNENRFHL